MTAPLVLHVLEADLRTRASATTAALLALADPTEAHRAELRANGVAPVTVSALYPVELADVIAGWRALLDDQALLAACNPLLAERQFEAAVLALPQPLAITIQDALAAAGLDENTAWAGAFAAAHHQLDAEWPTYQFGNLFAFVRALTTAGELSPELFMPFGSVPDPEIYDGAWRMLGKWVVECETVTAQLIQAAAERVLCPR